jgi:serine/threonine protein kinase
LQHTLRDRRVVNKVDLVSVLADVARALVRCHSTGHIHRDVKARNVLVTADYSQAKLADFGLARPLVRDAQSAQFRRRAQAPAAAPAAGPGLATDDDNREEDSDPRRGGMTPRVGPRKYRAPEVEEGLCYGCPCDMYSFGVMIRELLAVLKRRTARRYGITIDFLGELSMLCMRTNPEGRPSAGEALALLQQHKDEALPTAMVAGISPAGVLHAHHHQRSIQGGAAANGNAVAATREHSPSSSWERREGHGVKRRRSPEDASRPSGTTDAVIFLAAQRGGPPPLDSDGETSASKGSREERGAKKARSRSANR